MNTVAMYAGSFDPVTNGHVDVITRAARLFPRVIMAVVVNPNKKAYFSVDQRVQMLQAAVGHIKNVEIDSFSGLLTDYLQQKKAGVLVRGLRAASDFEYEFQLAHANKQLASDIETVFIPADNRYTFISSNIVKEIARLGGCVTGMVPPAVEKALKEYTDS